MSTAAFNSSCASAMWLPMRRRTTTFCTGLHRVEAVQVYGPLHAPMGSLEVDLQRINTAARALDAELAAELVSPDDPQAADLLRERLGQTIWTFFHDFVAQQHDPKVFEGLADAWFSMLAELDPCHHEWAEKVFLQWGENQMPDVLDQLEDGEAARTIDVLFADCIVDLPRYELKTQRAHLAQRKRWILQRVQQVFPHHDVRIGSANASERIATAQRVPHLFEEQGDWIWQMKQMRWEDLPREGALPRWSTPNTKPCYLILHLFSGRRRPGDIHEALHRGALRRGIEVKVISCDTAVSQFYGDLTLGSEPWEAIMALLQQRRVSAVVCGPPCETYTEARYHVPDDAPPHVAWPRPLRSCERFFGLCGLSFKELRQCRQGTAFVLQCLLIAAWMAVSSGLFIMEHPWKPTLTWRPSVWTSAAFQLLEKLPEAKLWCLPQWKWGCGIRKPTGMFTLGMPGFGRSMFLRQAPGATLPDKTAIGRDPVTGQFLTHQYKEYPEQFCLAIAESILDRFMQNAWVRTSRPEVAVPADLADWVAAATAASGYILKGATIRPDYQGH